MTTCATLWRLLCGFISGRDLVAGFCQNVFVLSCSRARGDMIAHSAGTMLACIREAVRVKAASSLSRSAGAADLAELDGCQGSWALSVFEMR